MLGSLCSLKVADDDFFVRISRTAHQAGIRIDVFLFEEVREFSSRSQLLKAFKAGSVTVNGNRVKPSYRLKEGDVIEAVLPLPAPERPPEPQPVDLTVIYEDQHIVVIDKQAGLVVHPGAGTPSGTLLNGLLYRYRHALLVHRLDKDTSGVMVAALTPEAQFHLCWQFSHRQVEKRYLAIAWGTPPAAEFEISLPIGRHPTQRVRFAVVPHGREAISKFKVIKQTCQFTLLECKPVTGRTHQLRVHLQAIGMPILGDPLYTPRHIQKKLQQLNIPAPRQMLHALQISFTHPATNQRVSFTANPPADFLSLVSRLFGQDTMRKLLQTSPPTPTHP